MAHAYIAIDPTSLTPADAESHLVEVLAAYGQKLTPALRSGAQSIFVSNENGTRTELSYAALITDLHLTGACELHRLRWISTDPHGTVELVVPAGMPQMVIGTGPRTSEPLTGPGYLTNDVVGHLLSDVLHYRREVAELSDEVDMFRPAFRAYRSYLAGCISAVDAAVNHISWFARNGGANLSMSEVKLLSRKTLPLDEKLRKWIPIVTRGPSLSETGQEWAQYSAIKTARNAVVHVNDPDFMFAVNQAVDVINLCRKGVGGLLLEVASLLGRNPSVNVLRVARAPFARYVPKS